MPEDLQNEPCCLSPGRWVSLPGPAPVAWNDAPVVDRRAAKQARRRKRRAQAQRRNFAARTPLAYVLRRVQSARPLEQMIASGDAGGTPAAERVWTAAEMRAQEWVDELSLEDPGIDPILARLVEVFGDAVPITEVVIGCSLVDGPVLGVSNEQVVLGAEEALLELAGEDDLEMALRELVNSGDLIPLDNGVFVGPGLAYVPRAQASD